MTRGKGKKRWPSVRGTTVSSSCNNHLEVLDTTTPRLDDSPLDIDESNTESPLNQANEDEEPNEDGESEVRTRGDTQGSHAPNNSLGRVIIEPYLNSFIQEIEIVRTITDILRQYMPACGTWKSVPNDYKEILFAKFKENYTWLPHHEIGIKNSWDQTHKRNYKQLVYRSKRDAVKKVGGDIEKIRDAPPKYMFQEKWQKICDDRMSDPKYKEKCLKAKANRMTEKFGSITRHTGGSISFMEHGRILKRENPTLNITPDIVHERVHRKQKGKGPYCDNKSKRVKEVYDETISQDDSNPTPNGSFDVVKWVDASGGPNKGRVYSLGNTVHYRDIVETLSQSTPTTYPPSNPISEEHMQVIEERLAKEREEAAIREATIMEEARKMAEEARERESILQTTLAKCLERLNTLEAAQSGKTSKK